MRIMIVDDSAFMRMMIRTSVAAKGWLVVGEATDGVEVVVGTFAACFPDIVTMDSTMREMGGVDAVRELIKVFPEARIIMVSAIGQPMDRIKPFKLGRLVTWPCGAGGERMLQSCRHCLQDAYLQVQTYLEHHRGATILELVRDTELSLIMVNGMLKMK